LGAIISLCSDTGAPAHKQKPQRLAVVTAFDGAFVPASALANYGHSHWATIILHEPSHPSVAIDFAF
jgi:hypothetical protein